MPAFLFYAAPNKGEEAFMGRSRSRPEAVACLVAVVAGRNHITAVLAPILLGDQVLSRCL